MKAAQALAWLLAVAAAFAIGRLVEQRELASIASFREALAARDELERAHRLSAFLQRLGPEELPAAREALETQNIGVTREEVRLFMLAWSRFDAPGAFAWARAWPTQWSATLMEEAIYAWGFRDGRAALRELDAVEDPELQTRLRRSLLEGWLHSADRSGASEIIAAISEPQQRRRLAFLLAGETMRDGSEAVLRWAEAVPEDAPNDFKRGAFFLASSLVANQDPRRAAAWFEEHRTQAYSRGSLDAIARKWAEHRDPPELFGWLRGLSLDGERAGEIDEAVAAGFRVWVGKEPEAAEAWLAAALPDPELDLTVAELVRSRVRSEPASALEWAARIQDDGRRRSSTVQAVRSWRRRDPDAAQAWLDRSDLPEDVVQSILRVSPGRRAADRPAARQARR